MASDFTTGELFKTKVIVEADVVGAVETILFGDRNEAHPLAEGYTLDLAAALKGHAAADAALASPVATLAYRRNMVRTAILLARPVKGVSL